MDQLIKVTAGKMKDLLQIRIFFCRFFKIITVDALLTNLSALPDTFAVLFFLFTSQFCLDSSGNLPVLPHKKLPSRCFPVKIPFPDEVPV